MTLPVADGQSPGDLAEGLPEADTGAPARAGEDRKSQPQANEETFTKAEVDAMIADAKAAAEKDIGAVRSDLMKSQNEQRQEWAQAEERYRDQLHQLTVRDMDDNTRNAYEAQINAERAKALQQQLRQTEEQLALSMQMGEYVQQLNKQFGVELEDLDMSDMDRLSETAWNAAARSHQDALQELAELREARQSPQASEPADGLPEAPPVVTEQGTATAAIPSIMELRKQHSADPNNLISEDDLFTMAENPALTGVNLDVVIQALAAEQDLQE